MEDEILDPEPVETPSPEDEDLGTPPEDEPAPEEEAPATTTEEEDAESWRALRAKYPNMTEAQLRRQVGDQYWEAKNYASRLARENEELREQLRKEKPEEPEEPEPNPQLEALDKRIQGLYEKDQSAQKSAGERLTELAAADKDIAKLEARIEDAQDDYTKQNLQARLDAATTRRQAVIDRYNALVEKREGYAYEMERLLTDKDWLTKVNKQQAQTKKSKQADDQRFNAQFPEYVDSVIANTANELGAPADEATRRSLWVHVNRAMMVELQQIGEGQLDDVDVEAMVQGYVKEYLTDRDLVSRSRFERRSAEKRKVTAAPRTAPVPVAKRPPVKPALMNLGDQTPAMQRARRYLSERGL